MSINYRRIYHKLKHRYPSIERSINTPGHLDSLTIIPSLHEKFCTIAGITPEQLRSNCQVKIQFIGVIAIMDDPQFFDDQYTKLRSGLAIALSNVLACHRTQISHDLQTVRNYLGIYPKFREEIDLLYAKMTE